jgi:hypothetical protein
MPSQLFNPSSETAANLRSQLARNLLWNALIDGLGPLVVYRLVSPHVSPLAAIGWSVAPPAANNLVTIVRKRQVDFIGIIVIVGLLIGLVCFLLGGSPRLILVRDSFVSGAIGALFLVSLLFPRPLLFYIARQLVAANDTERETLWNTRYNRSRYKYGLPIMTAVWGIVLLTEATLRVIMVLSLSITLYLATSPVINLGMYIVTIIWSLGFGRRMSIREETEAAQREEAAQAKDPALKGTG